MGADLIGYLVAGPERIPDDDRTVEQIARRMDAFAARIDRLFRQEDAELSGDEEWLLGELESLLDDETAGRLDPAAIARAIDTAGVLPGGTDSTEALARFLVRAWNELLPNARDVAFRQMPGDETRRILFAGDMTWGDAPDGTGYALLRVMHGCGFAAAVGIA